MIVTSMPPDPAAIAAGPHAPFVLLVIAAWGLANCFLGYPLFRVLLMLHGSMTGWVLGTALAERLRSAPTPMDYFIAGGVLAVLAGMTAWFACKATFALGAFWLATVFIAKLPGETSTLSWMVGGVIGAVVGAIVYRHLRNAIVLITSVAGAAAAVLGGALLCTAGQDLADLVEMVFGQQRLWLGWMLAIMVVLLACAGIMGQVQLAERVSDIFMPPRSDRQKKIRSRAAKVHPKFAKF